MAQLQYIGARYVPKFYENPNTGDMTWKSSETYEPLTVVSYQGNTYTSKISVPATVGNPAANTAYWAKTADYNAAIAGLTARVVDLENEIQEINGRPRYIFIGDSYAIGTGAGISFGWLEQVKTILGLTEGVDVFSYGAGGYGFIGNSGQFIDLLNNAINDISEPDTITDIIVVGGYNDIGDAGVTGAINTFVSTAKTAFPRAKTTIMCCTSFTYASGKNPQDALSTVHDYMESKGARIVPHLYDVLMAHTAAMSSDGIHPTESGYEVLARQIARVILGSDGRFAGEARQCTFTPITDITFGSAPTVYWRRSYSEIGIWFTNFIANVANQTGNLSSAHIIGNLSDLIFNPISDQTTLNIAETVCRIETSTDKIAATACITIRHNGDVLVRFPDYIANNNISWADVTKITIFGAYIGYPIDIMVL